MPQIASEAALRAIELFIFYFKGCVSALRDLY
jgi:hypothetical protein